LLFLVHQSTYSSSIAKASSPKEASQYCGLLSLPFSYSSHIPLPLDIATKMTSSNHPQKPSIVIVPASFSPAYFYDNIVDQLTANGYEAQTIELPSVGRKDGVPGATMAEDAASIQSVMSRLADEGKDIVIVTHSYGGIPGTESVRGMGKAEREKDGKRGGVARIVYLTSIVAPVGLSSNTLMEDTFPDWLKVEVSYVPLRRFALAMNRRSLPFSLTPSTIL